MPEPQKPRPAPLTAEEREDLRAWVLHADELPYYTNLVVRLLDQTEEPQDA